MQSFYHPGYFLSCLILNINRKLRKIFLTTRSVINYVFDLFLFYQKPCGDSSLTWFDKINMS